MNIIKFEDLEIWKSALLVTKDVYDLTSQGKFSKDFGLRDQIRRAVVSISSNIVEGFEKRNNNEFRRFLMISKGSAGEVRNQLYIALAIGYINQQEFDKINEAIVSLSKRIGAFINYLTKK